MLTLRLDSGDYFKIGEDVTVQLFRDSGGKLIVSIDAPREVPIVRGAVLEREGGEKPDHLLTKKPKTPSDRIHAAKQLEKHLARKETGAADGGKGV